MSEEERFISPLSQQTDERQEETLRPQTFDEFVGQPNLKNNLSIYIEAAIKRNEPLDHVLLSGPPGLGKTTLAFLIASQSGHQIYHTSGPALDKPGDLVGLLTKLEEGDILFIDEIHRISHVLEEHLYSAMEDFYLDIVLDSGPAARSVRLDVKRFTLVGATTLEGKLSKPFRDRFHINEKLSYYDPQDLEHMIDRSCRLLNINIDEGARSQVSQCSRGTPRLVNRLLRRLRDFAQVQGDGSISQSLCSNGLRQLGIDSNGLDEMDRKLLTILADMKGQPVGVKTLAVSLGEDEETIEAVYEPFLVQQGFLIKTPKGRLPTDKAYTILGRQVPTGPLFDNPE